VTATADKPFDLRDSIQVERVAVVGMGTMGTGISQRLAVSGYTVMIYDISESAVERALVEIEEGPFGLNELARRNRLRNSSPMDVLARITPATDLGEACANADAVIEAVDEDLAVKLDVFRVLDSAARAGTILASNTSGFPIEMLAAVIRQPERVVGWHWAAPAQVMKLAEIVVHARTSGAACATIVEMARRCDANPEVIRDNPYQWGFVTNRLLLALFREAGAIVNDGIASTRQVDQLARDCFRWPEGPFELQFGTRITHENEPQFAKPPQGLVANYHAGSRKRHLGADS
jgi:3-hydroxybutyryl-CoA dehydrogenase